jgi:hypothetical protein
MELQVALNQNIRFLLVEVDKQLGRTGAYLREPTPSLAEKIHASDDYVDNLKTFIQTKCFSLAVEAGSADKTRLGRLKALEVVAVNLERISDFCERVVDQVGHFQDRGALAGVDLHPFIQKVQSGIQSLGEALESNELAVSSTCIALGAWIIARTSPCFWCRTSGSSRSTQCFIATSTGWFSTSATGPAVLRIRWGMVVFSCGWRWAWLVRT